MALRMNILFIDTSSNQEIIVGLEIDRKKYFLKEKIGVKKSQVVLPMIERLLNNHKISIRDIGEIRVHTGPGSFTGLRVGISIANALSFTLKIPVNGKKIRELVEPSYE